MASDSKQSCHNAEPDEGHVEESEEILYSANGCEFVAVKSEPLSADEDYINNFYCYDDSDDSSICSLPVIKEEPPVIDIESDDCGQDNSSNDKGRDTLGSSGLSNRCNKVQENTTVIEFDVPVLDVSDLPAKLRESLSSEASKKSSHKISGSETKGFRGYSVVSQTQATYKPHRKIGTSEENGMSRYPVVSLTRLSETYLRSDTVKLSSSTKKTLWPVTTPAVAPVDLNNSPYVPVRSKYVSRKVKSIGPKGALSHMFYCHHCDYVSKNKSTLSCHALGHLPRQFHCTVCPYKSVTHKYLQQHMQVHTGETSFSCTQCDFKTRWKHNLTTHLRTHSGERPYACHLCPYMSKTSSSLKTHVDIHYDRRKWKCLYCPYAAYSKFGLKEHMTVHTGEKGNACTQCDFKTSRSSSLREHIRLKHVRNKHLQCPYCEYRSGHKGNMMIHVRTHTKEKPYACEKCDYRASSLSTLKSHLLNHSGVRRFACDYCSYRSVQQGTMKAHVDRVHFDLKPLQCYHCDYRASRKLSLRMHMSKHMKTRVKKCRHPGCAYYTLNRSLLRDHQRKHNSNKRYTCSLCPHQSDSLSFMKKHLLCHKVTKTYTCTECSFSTDNRYPLKNHMLLHNGK